MQRVREFGQVHGRRPFAAGHLQLLPSTCLRWWTDCLSYGRYNQQIDGPCFSIFSVDGGGGRRFILPGLSDLKLGSLFPIPYLVYFGAVYNRTLFRRLEPWYRPRLRLHY